MNMGLVQYCLMDYCLKLEKNVSPLTELGVWVELGLKPRLFQKAATWLLENEYLTVCELKKIPVSTGKHRKVSEAACPNLDSKFEAFWKSERINGRLCAFTGSKADAKRLFKKAANEVGTTFLMSQKLWYFRLLSENPDRPALMGATFLAERSKRYTENFKAQCKGYYPNESKGTGKQLSVDETKKLFEQ